MEIELNYIFIWPRSEILNYSIFANDITRPLFHRLNFPLHLFRKHQGKLCPNTVIRVCFRRKMETRTNSKTHGLTTEFCNGCEVRKIANENIGFVFPNV